MCVDCFGRLRVPEYAAQFLQISLRTPVHNKSQR